MLSFKFKLFLVREWLLPRIEISASNFDQNKISFPVRRSEF
jgi:hypothetical protein